jgi:hypothetical protein
MPRVPVEIRVGGKEPKCRVCHKPLIRNSFTISIFMDNGQMEMQHDKCKPPVERSLNAQ